MGSPDAVAAQMAEAMEEVGGDRLLFSMPIVSQRITAPALQQRGLTWKAYGHKDLRDNLLEL